MPTLGQLFIVLDILLAAFVATLLTRFWTSSVVETSVDQLEQDARAWGVGGLLFIPGILLNLPAAMTLDQVVPLWADLAKLAGYPFFLVGVYLMFHATFPDHGERVREGSA